MNKNAENCMNNVELKNALKNNTCKVKFNKINGDVRTMICTLNFDLIPKSNRPVGQKSVKNDSIITVWDIENEGWRSFRVDSIIEWNEE
jgi:hypothetical protein